MLVILVSEPEKGLWMIILRNRKKKREMIVTEKEEMDGRDTCEGTTFLSLWTKDRDHIHSGRKSTFKLFSLVPQPLA